MNLEIKEMPRLIICGVCSQHEYRRRHGICQGGVCIQAEGGRSPHASRVLTPTGKGLRGTGRKKMSSKSKQKTKAELNPLGARFGVTLGGGNFISFERLRGATHRVLDESPAGGSVGLANRGDDQSSLAGEASSAMNEAYKQQETGCR